MAKWIHNIQRDIPIEIFTTNYDLLIEEAFEKIAVPYFDGFVGSKRPFFDLRAVEDSLAPKHWSRLWKVHGSINWFVDNGSQVYRSTSLTEKDLCLIYPSHLKYDQSRKMPYLALIDRLNAFLRQSGAVLIMSGYSFNDMHLNDTIVNALKANPTAIVIGLLYGNLSEKGIENEDNSGKYSNAIVLSENRSNLSLWAYDEGIIGGLRGKWRPTAPINEEENLARAIRYFPKVETDDVTTPERHELQLGDFDVLGNFLQELIGQEQFKLQDAK